MPFYLPNVISFEHIIAEFLKNNRRFDDTEDVNGYTGQEEHVKDDAQRRELLETSVEERLQF